MPIYEYVCLACYRRADLVRAIADRNSLEVCPSCHAGFLERDVVASMKPHTDTGYQSPILSDSLGIHPDQIGEATRRFPHHKFAPDGRMILESHQQRERVLKDLGFYDRN